MHDSERNFGHDILPLHPTPMRKPSIRILDYRDDLAWHFRDINAEWINAMFQLEGADHAVLNNPRERILEAGGAILFAEVEGHGIVGTCALQKTGGRSVELTKMGVRANARGLKVGAALLKAAIERASSMHADPIFTDQRALRSCDPSLRKKWVPARPENHAGIRHALCALQRGDAVWHRAHRHNELRLKYGLEHAEHPCIGVHFHFSTYRQ